MLYEFNINSSSENDIKEILKKSKVLKLIVRNIGIILGAIALTIMLFISFVANKLQWNDKNIILIVAYIIGVIIVCFRKNINIERYYSGIEKQMGVSQYIEVKDDRYIYKRDGVMVKLQKNTIQEVIVSEKYTLILLLPSKFKLLLAIPVIIPNSIFETKEKYNQFISSIKGE